MNLNGTWRLCKLPHGQSHSFVFERDFTAAGWLEAQVPGDVRTALRAGGYLDGYYLGKQLDGERWIDETDWLYYRCFDAPNVPRGRTTLQLDGVDTLAEVWLNGTLVGRCNNMFLPWSFDVTEQLRAGERNQLLVRVLSTVRELEGVDRAGLYPAEDTDRLLLRKSQMNFGWDFCGHCQTAGLWKSVRLHTQTDVELADVFLRTASMDEERAVLAFQACLRPLGEESADGLEIRLCLRDQGETAVEARWTADEARDATLPLPAPKLWWPRPYGEAHLYSVTAELWRKDQLLDQRAFRFGVRTIELLQPRLPEGGRGFTLCVNGRKLFIRGSNWVPTNAVCAECDPERTRYYLRRAVESNFTMLRVWGGGIYESELFFDLCDEYGILVMQDFMLACGVLPQDEAFLRNVSREVAWVVRHYRNRASLAVWSGDNELDQAYWWYDLQAMYRTNRVNRVAVREAVQREDPFRPFLVSSPCSPFEDEPGGDDPNSPLQGDMHEYLTRFTADSPYDYKKLLGFVPRFMSEYGFSSLPSRDSYSKFNFYNKPLDMQANPWLGELPAFQRMAEENRVDDMIYYTQYTHAWGLKYSIEYMRSHKGVCSGILYWKFNDPIAPNRENMLFPSLMSVIDFYGLPKLPYDYARRAYEDVILAFREEEGALAIYACNETLRAYAGQLRVRLMGYHATLRELWAGAVRVEPDAATRLCVLPVDEALEALRDGYVLCELDGELALSNRFFFGHIGEYVDREPPATTLRCRVTRTDCEGAELLLQAQGYAQDVCLNAESLDAAYSDNAFCMDAGSERLIRVTLPEAKRDRLWISARNAKTVCLRWSGAAEE